jgi:hypothetical protein
VNCYVTTYAYPFDNSTTYVTWMGGSTYYHLDARSDKDGRANTTAITDATGGAVKICKDLGTGWYLPAYEELVNMSAGEGESSSTFSSLTYTPLNGLAGAKLLTTSTGIHWSSTEHYNHEGRYDIMPSEDAGKPNAVRVNPKGTLSNYRKANTAYVRCVWRP